MNSPEQEQEQPQIGQLQSHAQFVLHGRVLFALNDMHKDAVGVWKGMNSRAGKVEGRVRESDTEISDIWADNLWGQHSLELSAEHV